MIKAKIKLLALSLTAFFAMASCSADDTPGVDENLFGTWTLDATLLTECANPSDNSTTNAVCDTEECVRLVLTSDRRYERRVTQRGQEEVTERGQLRIGESSINFLPDNNTSSLVLNYALNANTLLLTNLSSIVCNETLRYTK